MRKKLGASNAEQLMHRFQQLRDIDILGQMVHGNPHPLVGKRKGQFSVSLTGGFRLVFKAIEPIPKTQDNATDWRTVSKIQIIFVGDYHE